MNNYNSTPLKHCPFCGSKALRTGGTIGDTTIRSCRCSRSDCIAAFKSVDFHVWNTRPSAVISDQLTIRKWIDAGHSSGFGEVVV